jgi:hypothetical protein
MKDDWGDRDTDREMRNINKNVLLENMKGRNHSG